MQRHSVNYWFRIHQGRVKPIEYTVIRDPAEGYLAEQNWRDLDPEQVMLGMMADPIKWQTIPMIKVSHPGIGEILNIDGKYASFLQFFEPG